MLYARIILALLCAISCWGQQPSGSEAQEWERIRETKDITLLQRFLAGNPSATYADLASRRIDQLDWEAVDKKDDDAVRRFLKTHPDMKLATLDEASRARIPAAAEISVPDGSTIREISEPAHPKKPDPDAAAVVEAIKRYAKALQDKNTGELKNVWPSIPADVLKNLHKTFKQAKMIRVDVKPIAGPVLDGDRGMVYAWRTTVLRYNGKDHTSVTKLRFRVQRNNAKWQIAAIL